MGPAAARPLVCCSLALAAAVAGAQQAASGTGRLARLTRAQVLERLEAGARPEDWRALGDRAVTALGEVGSDPALPRERREAAVDALGGAGTPDAADALRRWVKDARAKPWLRARAAAALARCAGTGAVPDLVPALEGAEGELLRSVARALASLGGQDARTALEERLAREDDADAREVLQRSLTALEP